MIDRNYFRPIVDCRVLYGKVSAQYAHTRNIYTSLYSGVQQKAKLRDQVRAVAGIRNLRDRSGAERRLSRSGALKNLSDAIDLNFKPCDWMDFQKGAATNAGTYPTLRAERGFDRFQSKPLFRRNQAESRQTPINTGFGE